MAKTPVRQLKSHAPRRRQKESLILSSMDEESYRGKVKSDPDPLIAKTESQAAFISSIKVNTVTFGIGPAGTGKTYLATTLACNALMDGTTDRIIITRPAVEAGEELGFMPGDLSEKFAPYFAPVRQVLERRLGRGAVEMYLKNEKILILPLAHMRGWTFDDAFVVLDEAQNTSPAQMKMFLTRIGDRTKVVVDGDLSQRDLPGPSGLADSVRRIQSLVGVGVVTFTKSDVVRSGLTQRIVECYEEPSEEILMAR